MPLPELPDSNVWIDVRKQFRKIEHLENGKVRLTILDHIDVGLSLIPIAIRNNVMLNRFKIDLPKFKQNFANCHSQYTERVAARPEFYKKWADYVTK